MNIISFFNLTLFIFDFNLNSHICFFCWSSHIITLFKGNFGFFPPPTNAIIFVLNNISTKPVPPFKSIINKYIKKFDYVLLEIKSLNGHELYIWKPYSVPIENNDASWLKPKYNILLLGSGSIY